LSLEKTVLILKQQNEEIKKGSQDKITKTNPNSIKRVDCGIICTLLSSGLNNYIDFHKRNGSIKSFAIPQSSRKIVDKSFTSPYEYEVNGGNEIVKEKKDLQINNNQEKVAEEIILNLKSKIIQLESSIVSTREERQTLKNQLARIEIENKKLLEENYELKKRRETAIKEINELSNKIKTPSNSFLRREATSIGGWNSDLTSINNCLNSKDIQKLGRARTEIEAIYKEIINYLFVDQKNLDSDKNIKVNNSEKNLDWIITIEKKINNVIKYIKEIQANYAINIPSKKLNNQISSITCYTMNI